MRTRRGRDWFGLWVLGSLVAHGAALLAAPVRMPCARPQPQPFQASLELPRPVLTPPRLESTQVPQSAPPAPPAKRVSTSPQPSPDKREERPERRQPAAPPEPAEAPEPATSQNTVDLWDDVSGGGGSHQAAIDAVGGVFGSAALAPAPGAEGNGAGQDAGEGDSLAGGGTGAPLGLAAPVGQSLPRPSYPEQARRRGEEGEVRLRLLVGVNGDVEQVTVAVSSGYPALDEAAREEARLWRFSPARRGGHAIRAWVEMPVRFRLDDPV